MSKEALMMRQSLPANDDSDPASANQSLPEHLLRLDSQWALWKCAGLRGAGFPAERVLGLASPHSSTAADHLIALETDSAILRQRAIEAVNRMLDRLRERSEWDNKAMRDPLMDARRLLKAGKIPSLDQDQSDASIIIGNLKTAEEDVESALTSFTEIYKSERKQLSESIRREVGDKRFHEAVIWQNRKAFYSGMVPLLRNDASVNKKESKTRQHEELVAGYLQRYAVKNDTIGFFGPVGWATLVNKSDSVVAVPGKTLIADRNIYFEIWGIDALAQKLGKDPRMKPWIMPRRPPYIYIEGDLVHFGTPRPARLPLDQLKLLTACDGKRTAKAIASILIQDHHTGFSNEQAVYNSLEALCKRGMVLWTLEVTIDSHPELLLKQLLGYVEDEDLRTQALDSVSALETARDAISLAAGNAGDIDRALENFDRTFTGLTSISPTRNEGQMYAGRTLVYEDCRRDIEIEFGSDLITPLTPALSLILHSARWITHKVADIFSGLLRDAYKELVRETGCKTVDVVKFWTRTMPIVFDEANGPVSKATAEFQMKWSEILDIPDDRRHLEYSSEQLRPRILDMFDAKHPGWKSACYHSPDLMIAASDIDAIRRGDYKFVLGEIHIGLNTLAAALFVNQHPNPEELLRAYNLDLPEPLFVPVLSKNESGAALRTRFALESEKDIRVAMAHDSFDPPGLSSLPVGAFVIDETADGIVLRTRDNKLSMDYLEASAKAMSSLVVNAFKIQSNQIHSPRITIDNLVIQRETWNFDPSEMEFAFLKNEAARFVATRRWASSHDLPRFMFVKVPYERKPFYLDFDSSIYVDILAKAVRRSLDNKDNKDNRGNHTETLAGKIGLSEMLPDIKQSWLPDAEGNHYTSEIRLVALDLSRNC